MAKNKISPLILLLPGVAIILAAIIGHFGGLFSGGGQEAKSASTDTGSAPAPATASATASATAAPAAKSPKSRTAAARSGKLDLSKTKENEEKAKERARSEENAQMTKILLAQIRKSPDTLDLDWIGSFAQHIDDEASFRRYFDDIERAGGKRYDNYLRRQQRSNMEPTGNPYFFLEEAKRTLFSKNSSADKMAKQGLAWLAAAYYKEQDSKGGWEFADEGFMTAFFKQSIGLYGALLDSARANNNDVERWQRVLIRTHEAKVMDRYLRIKGIRRDARDKLANTASSGARAQLSQDRMQQQINTSLLALGRYYLDEAANETSDIRRLRYHAEHTFQAMAMVYQRKPSSDALSALREVNEVQRSYLYRMALVSWQRAKEAAQSGDLAQADDYYFTANKHYLQCLSRWGAVERDAHEQEFRRLKQDIAAWQRQKRAVVVDAGT